MRNVLEKHLHFAEVAPPSLDRLCSYPPGEIVTEVACGGLLVVVDSHLGPSGDQMVAVGVNDLVGDCYRQKEGFENRLVVEALGNQRCVQASEVGVEGMEDATVVEIIVRVVYMEALEVRIVVATSEVQVAD